MNGLLFAIFVFSHSLVCVLRSQGRELTATILPKEQKAEIELIDSSTEAGATWVAAMDVAVGSKPTLKLIRQMKI